jgi:hypothetical protein
MRSARPGLAGQARPASNRRLANEPASPDLGRSDYAAGGSVSANDGRCSSFS